MAINTTDMRAATNYTRKLIMENMRLALLMELMSDVKKSGSKWSIPLRLFHDVNQAADALLNLER